MEEDAGGGRLETTETALLQGVTSFLPSAGYSWLEARDGALFEAGAEPACEGAQMEEAGGSGRSGERTGHGSTGFLLATGSQSSHAGVWTHTGGAQYTPNVLVVPSIMMAPHGMMLSMDASGQDPTMGQTFMLVPSAPMQQHTMQQAVNTMQQHTMANVMQQHMGTAVTVSPFPPSPFEFASAPAAPQMVHQGFSFEVMGGRGTPPRPPQQQQQQAGPPSNGQPKSRTRLAGSGSSGSAEAAAALSPGGGRAGGDSDMEGGPRSSGPRIGTSVSAVAAQLLQQQQDQDQRQPTRPQPQRLTMRQQQYQQGTSQPPSPHASPQRDMDHRSSSQGPFGATQLLAAAAYSAQQDQLQQQAAQLQAAHQARQEANMQQQHQQYIGQMMAQHKAQQEMMAVEEQARQHQAAQQHANMLSQILAAGAQGGQPGGRSPSPSPPPHQQRASQSQVQGGLSGAAKPTSYSGAPGAWRILSTPVPEYHSFAEYEKKFGAAVKCVRGDCAIHLNKPCKEHRCACCKAGRQLVSYSRQGWCGPCSKREIVGGLTFVRCGRCKAEMLEATYQAHLKQNVAISDSNGNKVTGRCRDKPKEMVETDKGRRCGKCTNMRPLTFYSSEDTNCSCNIHVAKQLPMPQERAPTPPAPAPVLALPVPPVNEAGRDSPTNTGTTTSAGMVLMKGQPGETGISQRVSTAGTRTPSALVLTPTTIATAAVAAAGAAGGVGGISISPQALQDTCSSLATSVGKATADAHTVLNTIMSALAACRTHNLAAGGPEAQQAEAATNQLAGTGQKAHEAAQRLESLAAQLRSVGSTALSLANQRGAAQQTLALARERALPVPQLQAKGAAGTARGQPLWPAHPGVDTSTHASPFIVVGGPQGARPASPAPSSAGPPRAEGSAAGDQSSPKFRLPSAPATQPGADALRLQSLDLALLPSTLGPSPLWNEPSLNTELLGTISSLNQGLGLGPVQQQMMHAQLLQLQTAIAGGNSDHNKRSATQQPEQERPSKMQQVIQGVQGGRMDEAADTQAARASADGTPCEDVGAAGTSGDASGNDPKGGSGEAGSRVKVEPGTAIGSGDGQDGAAADPALGAPVGVVDGSPPVPPGSVSPGTAANGGGPAPLAGGGFSDILMNIPSQLFT